MKDKFKKIFGIENRTKYFPLVLVCFFILSVCVFGLIIIGTQSLERQARAETESKNNPFTKVNIVAKSALVWDVVQGRELFSKNADEPLPLASLTKLMTAVVTENELSDSQKVVITSQDLKPNGDSNLIVGDTWKVRDLRDFTLITSSNDGAFALAAVTENKENQQENGFIEKMNQIAKSIGLTNSKFLNEHGLDINSDTGGAYGSAKDMALLFEYILKNHPDILEATRYKNLEFKSAQNTYEAENTNIIIDKIPNLIASKTGFTDLAGGNLIIAFDAGLGRPIVISVLGSTEDGRFSDVLQLVEASMKQINK